MNHKYYPEIDGLRALAVLAVILFHLDSKLLPGGFAGVDIFFAISGFVVSASIVKLQSASFSKLILEFYSRRILRILPALFLCLSVTMLASVLFIPSAWLSTNTNEVGLKAFFALSNFTLADMEGYFSPRAEFNPFTHTWSLAVEEQFYLLFPLLIIIGLKIKRQWTPIVLLTICSLIMSWYFTDAAPKSSFYLLHTRYWEIAAGIITFTIYNSGALNRLKNSILPQGLIAIGLTLNAISFAVSRSGFFPFPGALLPVLGTSLTLLGIVYANTNIISITLKSSSLVHVGRLSYSLYLWHWPVFVMFKWTVGLESFSTKAFALILTYCFAIFSFKTLEEPIRLSGFFTSRPRRLTLAFGVVLLFCGYSFSSFLNKNKNQISLARSFKESSQWHHLDIPPNKNACHIQITRTDLDISYFEKFTSSCNKDQTSQRKMFAIGDSHSGHWRTLYQSLALNQNIVVYAYNNGGCPFGRLLSRNTDLNCSENAKIATKSITSLAAPGDILFLSSLRLPRFTDQWAYFGEDHVNDGLFSELAIKKRIEAEEEFAIALEPFLMADMTITFVAPTFLLKDVTFRCVDWFNKSHPLCTNGLHIKKTEFERLRVPVFQSFERIAKIHKNISVWDPLPSICDKEYCQALTHDGTPILVDSDHLSPLANRMAESSFLVFLKKILEENRQMHKAEY